MTRIALACAAAGMLLAAPNFVAPASAVEGVKVAQVDVRIGAGPERRHWRRDHHRCRTTVIWRHGRKTVVKRCD